MNPSGLMEGARREALEAECYLHIRRMMVLSDPWFYEGNDLGWKQVQEGKTVTLAQLREKYGQD